MEKAVDEVKASVKESHAALRVELENFVDRLRDEISKLHGVSRGSPLDTDPFYSEVGQPIPLKPMEFASAPAPPTNLRVEQRPRVPAVPSGAAENPAAAMRQKHTSPRNGPATLLLGAFTKPESGSHEKYALSECSTRRLKKFRAS